MIKERLISLRERKGWSKTEAAKRLNIATSTYSGYEYGHRKPDNEMLVKISRLYEVTTDYLLGNDREYEDHFDRLEALMFKDIEGFEDLPPERQEAIRQTINEQIEFLVHKEKKDGE